MQGRGKGRGKKMEEIFGLEKPLKSNETKAHDCNLLLRDSARFALDWFHANCTQSPHLSDKCKATLEYLNPGIYWSMSQKKYAPVKKVTAVAHDGKMQYILTKWDGSKVVLNG